jgi:polar amino acid transport system substrate-binding protein
MPSQIRRGYRSLLNTCIQYYIKTRHLNIQRRSLLTFPSVKSLCRSGVAALSLVVCTAVFAVQVERVGATAGGIPFTFLDVKSNTIQGMMIDVVSAVGQKAGFDVQVQPMAFSSLVSALTSNKVDLLSAALLITPAHQQVMAFSDPIYAYGEALVVPKTDTKPYVSFNDLKGMTVGGQIGTIYVDALKKSGVFKEVKAYDSTSDLMRDLNSGRIQAAIADGPVIAYYLKQGLYPATHIVASYKPTMVGSLGIGMRKDDEAMQARVNKALKELVADGTMNRILAKWGLH